ncbi:hypothetical protein B0T11DRAFT_49889 [Plectosphaerella cucumerina]|uniref:Zn(2)-C6 fungal-type domain-containing protein n=1 Tax=Plectosphaerella cucumerina TaxID=40658 RepID=A0A8K0TGC1_9PEZI|nr:hypothetical protein B0T11DRAFT_49889 [Plectosphaerella cucumerina]
MPRPKVRPEDRQRAVRACVPCKNSKKRCDARLPCSNCCRRECEAACIFDSEPYPRHRSSETRRSNRAVGDHERREHHGWDPNTTYEDASHAPHTPDSTLAACSDVTPGVPSPPQSTIAHLGGASRMGGSKGEKVNMGDSPSLSFLHFLRRTLLHYMGPSPFTDNRRANVMLEAVIPLKTSDSVPDGSPESQLDVEEKRQYLERFFTATTGLVYLFSPAQLSQMLDEREARSNNSDQPESYTLRDSIIDLAISIGGQCCETTPKSLYHAQRHFERGQKLAFEGMLLDPSVDMICVFLLMSVYMLGTCKRNGAFMYLGVAARSAHALGLHVPESYQHLEAGEQMFRSQVWKSLRILDIAIGSVLSRPPASSPRGPLRDAFTPTTSIQESPSPEYLSMNASFEVCTILEEIMDHLDHKRDVNITSIEEFLTRLRRWSQSLPPSVRSSSVTWPLPPEKRRQALGNFAVSCFYYFSVILITRPILISYLLMKLKLLDPSTATSAPCLASSPEAEQIAQVCVDAAILMAETARRAQSAGLLIQNMCLLKAWLFSASLVLGFSVFVDASSSTSPTSFDAEAALHGSINVIKELARTSPQAHHYLDVLTEFLGAIKQHRERLVPPRRRSSGQYLSQIFVLDQERPSGDSDMDSVPTLSLNAPEFGADTSSAGLWMLQQAAEATQDMNDLWKLPDANAGCNDSGLPGSIAASVSLPMGAFDLDWSSVSVQVTESSLFDMDPFMNMMDQC